jgi:hypothetical protein
MWLVGEDRIFGVNEPIAQELLDVVEEVLQAGDTKTADWLSKGRTGSQTGWERHKALYLLWDDIAPFWRALYNGYAGDIRPWKDNQGKHAQYRSLDGRLADGDIAGLAGEYTFCEHPQGGSPDKTHGEAVFLEYIRNVLVMEIGDVLWLARATPRAWLNFTFLPGEAIKNPILVPKPGVFVAKAGEGKNARRVAAGGGGRGGGLRVPHGEQHVPVRRPGTRREIRRPDARGPVGAGRTG